AAQERQRQHQEARIAGGGDQHDGENERRAEAEADTDHAGDDALPIAQRGRKVWARPHDCLTLARSHRPTVVAQCGWISSASKKYGISNAAEASESDPWTALASIEEAKSFRIVPGAALAGSVAPIISRARAMASS